MSKIYRPIIAGNFILNKKAGTDNIIEGIVSMEMSKRDFDICPASAFNVKQYMINPQVWYNHNMWRDKQGNEIPAGRTLELYQIKIEKIDDNNYGAVALNDESLIGLIPKEKIEALNIKENDSGLWAKIRIDVPEIWERIENGSLNAFSWQGKAEIEEVWSTEHDTMVRQCSSIDLMEISVVTIPANERSFFTVAKSFVGSLSKQNDSLMLEKADGIYDFCPTEEDPEDGHYHIVKFENLKKMYVGRTILTAKGVDHVHAVNCSVDNSTTGNSNLEDRPHFHKFYKPYKPKKAKIEKSVSKFKDLPLAPLNTKWIDSSHELLKSNSEDIYKVFILRDDSQDGLVSLSDPITGYYSYVPNTKAYQLPIAMRIDGELMVVFEAVEKAMSDLLTEKVSVSVEEYKKAYKHLALYYKKFGKVVPLMKMMKQKGKSVLGKVKTNCLLSAKKSKLKN